MAKDGNGSARGSQELPRNHDAEQSVLGSMIRDNHVIPDVVNEMRPESLFPMPIKEYSKPSSSFLTLAGPSIWSPLLKNFW